MDQNSGVARRWFVEGRVQGVGFRWFVQKHARAVRLKGYVRNLDDGRVEVYAMGSSSELDGMRNSLWRGPPSAQVRDVQEQESTPETLSGFRILD
ncbi:MAG: acylphosphatase [Bryobacteraceae bacterium]|nr:acylphosphatase [Bryobacteraceae bacterium]